MKHDRQRWVFLADPEEYGWDALLRDGGTEWDGIRNAQAKKHLGNCRPGDAVLLYHTAPDRALVGVARVVAGVGGPAADDATPAVRIEPVAALGRAVPLNELKADPVTAGASFVRMPRVAVHPVSEDVWDRVMTLSGTDPGTASDTDPANVGGP
jgi:predicted RNA-binding protein with PUA-like domain